MFGFQTVTVRHTRRKFSTTHYYESISFRDVSVIHLHDATAPMNLNKFELGDVKRGKKSVARTTTLRENIFMSNEVNTRSDLFSNRFAAICREPPRDQST